MPAPISVDEYLSKRTLSAHDGIVYRAAKMPKTFNGETRSAVFVMTDESTDSYGDIVKAKGADMDRFDKNPICLLNHRSDLILGTWSGVAQKGKSIEGTVTLAAEGTAPHIDMAYGLMSQGILRAASIGLMPKKVERRLDDNGEPLWSYIIHEWELYECSVVSVPANPAALAKAIKQGDTIARDFLEEVLDTYVKTPAGLIVSRADLEAAHKDATGDKTTTIGKVGVELDAGSLDRLEKIAERMEKAAIRVTGATSDDELDTRTHVDMLEAEAVQELELNVEGFLKDFQPKVDELPEERKGVLAKLMDGVRAVFKAAEPEPEPEPVKADPEIQKALQERLSKIAERHKAAA